MLEQQQPDQDETKLPERTVELGARKEFKNLNAGDVINIGIEQSAYASSALEKIWYQVADTNNLVSRSHARISIETNRNTGGVDIIWRDGNGQEKRSANGSVLNIDGVNHEIRGKNPNSRGADAQILIPGQSIIATLGQGSLDKVAKLKIEIEQLPGNSAFNITIQQIR